MNIGDKIPEQLGVDQNGTPVTASEYAGQKLIIYFYPKDMTSGCTAEACSLRDNYAALQADGYNVIGVSPDDEAKHLKFIEKYELPFRLIADTDHRLAEEFGVWGEKSMYGRKYMGIFRTTFVVDADGRVVRIFTPKEIKTKIHGEQILNNI